MSGKEEEEIAEPGLTPCGPKSVRVLHIATSLMTGGAEVMLQKVARALRESGYNVFVTSLTSLSTIGAELQRERFPVVALGGRGGILLPHQLGRLMRTYRAVRPDIVHSWMYHANVVSHMLVKFSRASLRPALVTSVRGALHAPETQKLPLRILRSIDARLSRRADAVVFNSWRSAEQHVNMGYTAEKSTVIPNCFDTDAFSPNQDDRERVRSELGCPKGLLVGLVARFHPVKDHRTFLEAAAIVRREVTDYRFLLAGRGCDSGNERLTRWVAELGLTDRVYLLGERRDMISIQRALDIAVSSSVSESFPNSIGEAMACAVPCVVTDVGDCGVLVGGTGYVVPPRSPSDLAHAISKLGSLSPETREALGDRARGRVLSEYSLRTVIAQFEHLYRRCLGKRDE